jgi:glycosyltransferase involved in cell wall biosynthesis
VVQDARADPDLRVDLETELPERLEVGLGAALFVFGCCHHERQPITDLHLEIDGERHEVLAHGMPRREGAARLYGTRDPFTLELLEGDGSAYLSGFWGIVSFAGRERPTTVAADLVATLPGARRSTRRLGEIRLEPGDHESVPGLEEGNGAGSPPLIAICMATFDPRIELFERQIESIRNQTYPRWHCSISDDGSREDVLEEMRRVIGDDPRFLLSSSGKRLGFYGNFERSLSLIPREARLVAFADQDDEWYPDKLEALAAGLESGAALAYSDTRVVTEDGDVLSNTFWSHRANNHTNLGSLVVMNTITGAASLFRRELLRYVLPFPTRLGPHSYHDQWIAAIALALGKVAYIDRPLYDYVQHSDAVLGHTAAEVRGAKRRILHRLGSFFGGWRVAYFADYCRILLLARVLTLRCGDRMEPAKRRSLARVAGESPRRRAGWLTLRALRPVSPRSQTAGAERRLLRGMAWPHMVRRLGRTRRARRFFDASIPPQVRDALALRPDTPVDITELKRKIAPLELDVSTSAPERVNVLLPAVDLAGFFAGYLSIYNLANKLGERGMRTRIVTTEHSYIGLPEDWKAQIERKSGLRDLFDRVEIRFPRDEGRPLDVNPRDRFVASTWWTAHLAHSALSGLERERFLYLIQDYEPIFHPMGSSYALADQSYEFPHMALFSTELLRDFFRARAIGVFSSADGAGDSASTSFQNAITPVDPPSAQELRSRANRRLLFYARLEDYTPRNLFNLGVIALTDLIEEGVFSGEWEFFGVGTVGGTDRVKLGPDAVLELLPRQSETRYGDMLRKHDLGLSLMYSPHPSLVPLEMASAGILVVTNTYENKTPAALAEISENLVAVPPTVEGIKRGLREAVADLDDVERRERGARVNWSTDWQTSFNPEVMDRVTELLDGC